MTLNTAGAIDLHPAAYYDRIPRDTVRVWCREHARYGLPTLELVEWLKLLIGNHSAIEIGSGSGDLCHHLNIRGTDNYCQDLPEVQRFYELLGQPTVRYAPWVEKLDAMDAVRKYNPHVVVASWVTNWIDPSQPQAVPGAGSMYGVKEDELIARVPFYVLIGNIAAHAKKPILQLPHEEYALPFIRSRATHPALDRVFIWRNKELQP